MKKILLSMALIAMGVFSMSALSFKIEVNGVEVNEGDEVEITKLEKGMLGDAMIPHLIMTNITGANLTAEVEAEFLEVAQPETTTGQVASMSQFCFDSCVAVSSEVGVPVTTTCTFAPNESRTGDRAHVEYMPAYEGAGFWDVQKFYTGVSVLKFTLRNQADASDAITFSFKFNYTGENSVDGIAVDNSAAEYYNFQGVKVANPEKGGMYIVRRGAKVTKEIVK